MGIYLGSPNCTKHSVDGKNEKFQYGASGMQGITNTLHIDSLGWRVNMEDSHITKLSLDPNIHVFGVFDGHGGKILQPL